MLINFTALTVNIFEYVYSLVMSEINILAQKSNDINQDVYQCFTDENVLEKIKHGKVLKILERKNIDSPDIKIILTCLGNHLPR